MNEQFSHEGSNSRIVDEICDEFVNRRQIDPSLTIENFLADVDIDLQLKCLVIPELIAEDVESVGVRDH